MVSFNVRYGLAQDGEFVWAKRRAGLLDLLEQLDPDVLCLQEALNFQVEAIADRLKNHDWVGNGRDDGAAEGEFAPIFYKNMKPIRSGTFWLSSTPDVAGSIGWGARQPRICTWASFDGFKIANVHLDHESKLARHEGVALVLGRLAGKCLWCGDFNAEPDEPSIGLVTAAGFEDFAAEGGGTFNDFRADRPDAERIDYIFGRGVSCSEAKVIRRPLVSDHWPVLAECEV